jgi:hypothetical protein
VVSQVSNAGYLADVALLAFGRLADLEIGDTAGLETCGTPRAGLV